MQLYHKKPEHYSYHRDVTCYSTPSEGLPNLAKLLKDQKLFWEAEEWRHGQGQPIIKDAIIHALENYGAKSFSRIERDIDGWCCASTIYS
jgi:hypothetical protein